MIITEIKAALLDTIDDINRAMENAEDDAAEDGKDPVLALSWATKIIRNPQTGVEEVKTSLSFAVEKIKHNRSVYIDPKQMKLPFEVEAGGGETEGEDWGDETGAPGKEEAEA
jgi:hypothetical protein